MTEPVVDRAAIERLQRIGGSTLARQMIGLFLEHGEARVSSAGSACVAGDAAGVEQAAHSLKSSAGNVGARRLQNAAAMAERAAETGMVGEMPALVDEIRAEYAAAAAALNGLLVELDQ